MHVASRGERQAPKRPKLRMIVVPVPPPTQPVLDYVGEGTVIMVGTGRTDYVCGSCGATLLERIGPHQVLGGVFRCNSCGSHNEMPS